MRRVVLTWFNVSSTTDVQPLITTLLTLLLLPIITALLPWLFVSIIIWLLIGCSVHGFVGFVCSRVGAGVSCFCGVGFTGTGFVGLFDCVGFGAGFLLSLQSVNCLLTVFNESDNV